jgi:ribose/xylose/arabinose/galactoside ABC-type transport system permease subunit
MRLCSEVKGMKKTDVCIAPKYEKDSGSSLSTKPLGWLNKSMMLIILAIAVITFSVLSPYFLTLKNLYAVGLDISVIGIICVGQSLCIITRGFDLSVGFTAAYAGMLVAYLTAKQGLPYSVSLIIGLCFGGLVGLINGLLITKGKINALITTLATGFMLSGAVIILSKGYSIIVNDKQFTFIGTTKVLGIPLPLIILLILYVVFQIIMSNTVFGRHIYCIGGNPEAAKIAGINVQKLQIIVYVISGILSAFAGIVLASRMGAAQNSIGSTYAMDSIAAAVLGGTLLVGGEGKMTGTFLGVVIIGILGNGLIMLNIDQAYRNIATGLVLLLAVLMQNVNAKRA